MRGFITNRSPSPIRDKVRITSKSYSKQRMMKNKSALQEYFPLDQTADNTPINHEKLTSEINEAIRCFKKAP